MSRGLGDVYKRQPNPNLGVGVQAPANAKASCPPLLFSKPALYPPDNRGRAPSPEKLKRLRTHGRGAGHMGELAIIAQTWSGWSFPKNRQDGKS